MAGQIALYELGLTAYDAAHALQYELAERRHVGQLGDLALLLEHRPVITLGRRADPAHVLASPDELARLGIALLGVDRGGDVTYHGPGQLVVYPILRLHDHGLGVSDYMHLLEQVTIQTLQGYGIAADRREGLIGVWVGSDKICALGVRLRRGVTLHGLALNVAPQMRHWELIVPCGIRDSGVTSMAQVMGIAPPVPVVGQTLARHLAAALGVTPVFQNVTELARPQPMAADGPALP